MVNPAGAGSDLATAADRTPDPITAPALDILLVGHGDSMPQDDLVMTDGTVVHRCRGLTELTDRSRDTRPDWLLVGLGVEDYDIQHAVATVRAAVPLLRLGLLGPPHDRRRCESWLRRGCDAYLESTASLDRVVTILRINATFHIKTVDKVFFTVVHAGQPEPPPRLTRRETDVLRLLVRGLGNRDIAGALHVSENTVEFHMRHLLSKLSARSRLEAVERATTFGLT
jgi:DNA-binding NarL/FixJ family response regulator